LSIVWDEVILARHWNELSTASIYDNKILEKQMPGPFEEKQIQQSHFFNIGVVGDLGVGETSLKECSRAASELECKTKIIKNGPENFKRDAVSESPPSSPCLSACFCLQAMAHASPIDFLQMFAALLFVGGILGLFIAAAATISGPLISASIVSMSVGGGLFTGITLATSPRRGSVDCRLGLGL
jgi:hypothetical protein